MSRFVSPGQLEGTWVQSDVLELRLSDSTLSIPDTHVSNIGVGGFTFSWDPPAGNPGDVLGYELTLR